MSRFFPFFIFITVFLSIYGLLHYYFYRTLKKTAILGLSGALPVIIILVILFLAPVIMRLSDSTENGLLLNILEYAVYLWMVAIFLFFSIHILIDIYSLTARFLSGFLLKGLFIPGHTASFLTTVILIIAIICYGSFEARDIKLEKIELVTDKLPPGIHNIKIIQISDTHFSSINSTILAENIHRIINTLDPDILVSTGDIIERGMRGKTRIAGMFKGIKTTYGKFAVMGNHEFFTGESAATEFLENAGFRLLRNEGITIDGFLNIAGVDDPAGKRFGPHGDVQEKKLLENFKRENLTILLKHQPVIQGESRGFFDLQLSGHTHKGQIFPFTLIVSIFYRYMSGLHTVADDSYLYVSRGTGTWGPPVRFFAPPEITVVEYRKK